MDEEWQLVNGIVVAGHRVASGPSSEYPYGSLEKQKPYFKALGMDLEGLYLGTINTSIAPMTWVMVAAEYTFRGVMWTDLHPAEDFSFSACQVLFKNRKHPGWVYQPHPETKIRHFQNNSILEVISEFIPGLCTGCNLTLGIKKNEISISLPVD